MSQIFCFDDYAITVGVYKVTYIKPSYNEFTNGFIFRHTECIDGNGCPYNSYPDTDQSSVALQNMDKFTIAIGIEMYAENKETSLSSGLSSKFKFIHTKPRCKNCSDAQFNFFVNCLSGKEKHRFRLSGMHTQDMKMIIFYYNDMSQAWYPH